MRRMILLASLAIGLLAGDLEELRSSIKTQNVKGNFTQTKILSGFDKPFKSYGSFALKDDELLWDTSRPIVSHVVINKEGIFQKNGKDLVKTSQNFDEGLFLSMVKLDTNELEKEFDIKFEGDIKKGWRIALEPKNLLLKQIFTQISIFGDKFVRKIELYEVSGDKTINEFEIK
ncbi:LolA family protein [Campylobacter curvus]|uniref:LolA family protein n=1 Tax=Campylobacter curvus TaxID=200 RepID=UPI00035DFBF3|nr:outer membrane lipoprotein carrier protein LolA [Campylobacter curvus]QKF60780.1 putative LolA family chaperone [Campylobacter curvus]UEB49102.1 outer membrane lipoprotein carrier protein LolA [Campylobacter curvus]